MHYHFTINGMPVHAVYSKRSVEEIFLPLLQHLTAMHRDKGRRILVMMAAPPGTGKTTLNMLLGHLSESDPELTPIDAIGMDGFHYDRETLRGRSLLRDGVELPLLQIKGAPETFDLQKLRRKIEQLCTGEDTTWPYYDRLAHDPVDDALRVTREIVLLEGNYLLLDEPGWRELRRYADYTIRIDAQEETLIPRLLERKAATSGPPRAQVEAHVYGSDLPNARRCLEKSFSADLNLRMMQDGEYVRVRP